MKQAIRIFIAFVLLAVAVSVVIAGIQWINNPEHRGGPASDAVYMFAIAALAAVISAVLFRSFLRNRRPGEPRLGLFERLAARYPGLFKALSRFQVNGFGIELLDFHDRQEDGSFFATRWITVGFLPVGPIGRVRVRSIKERVRLWIPFVVTATDTYFDTLESLPVDRSRSLRVYLFYYLVFLPLAVGPLLGLLLWLVLARPDLSAGLIWGLIGVCLLWGVGLVWVQDWVMKRPRS
jgi:hypothetical protein